MELLTFDEWKKVWLDSECWHLRGRLAGSYRMYRIDKEKGFTLDNIIIDRAPKYRKVRKVYE